MISALNRTLWRPSTHENRRFPLFVPDRGLKSLYGGLVGVKRGIVRNGNRKAPDAVTSEAKLR